MIIGSNEFFEAFVIYASVQFADPSSAYIQGLQCLFRSPLQLCIILYTIPQQLECTIPLKRNNQQWFFMRKKIGFTIYVILRQLCVNCRADADAVILHHNSDLRDMITILTMHCAMMHHYLTVNCIIFNCSTSMHCEPLCSISSSALLATDELFICTVSIYV